MGDAADSRGMTTPAPTPTIAIRAATPADGRVLIRLATLDSAPTPSGPVLIAEADGEPKAALSLRDDRVVADPFSRTAELVALLRLHAQALAAREERAAYRPDFGRGLPVAA